jgi:hypothetical protein
MSVCLLFSLLFRVYCNIGHFVFRYKRHSEAKDLSLKTDDDMRAILGTGASYPKIDVAVVDEKKDKKSKKKRRREDAEDSS